MDVETSSPPEQLWRIVNFFELIAIIRTRSFRVARADQFEDLDEFLANALQINHLGWLLPTVGGGVDVTLYKDALRTCCFTTCWTKTRDSAAMWESYSKDYHGVQLECKFEPLQRTFRTFYPKTENVMLHHTPPDEGVVTWLPIGGGDCVYVDSNLYKTEIEKIASEYEEGGKAIVEDEAAFDEHHQKYADIAEKLHLQSLRTKDMRYSYEDEYRFSLISRTRNSMAYEAAAARPLFPLTDDHLRNTRPDETPLHIYMPFEPNVIERVYLDARLPKWQSQEQQFIINTVAPWIEVCIANR